MCTCQSLLACLLITVTSAVAMDERGKELPILDTFQGTIAKDKKPDQTSFIATAELWKVTWAKIHPKEKLPEIDFAKHLLLISTQNRADPNRQTVSVLRDEKGTVTVSVISTLIGFQPSDETIYRFHKISRAGVTGVNRFDSAQKKEVVDPLPK